MTNKDLEKEGIIYTPVPRNFVYPDITETDYRFGSGQVSGISLRPNGDWRDYLPLGEEQRRNGVESSACFIEASQHANATLIEEQYDIKDLNFSARFNMIFTNATPFGGSPIEGAQSIRKNGMIPESMLPFSDEIHSWSEFNSFKGGSERACIAAGKQFLKRWQLNWDIVFTRDEKPEIKIKKLREALKFSPIPLSVPAWFERDGVYFRPEGEQDNHLVEAVYVDDKYIYIFDTYSPFLKKVDININPEFAMRWSVSKIPQKEPIFQQIINLIKALFNE